MEFNDRAPFPGVLVPERQYRFYNEEIEACRVLVKAEDDCHSFESRPTIPYVVLFLSGLAVGYLYGESRN